MSSPAPKRQKRATNANLMKATRVKSPSTRYANLPPEMIGEIASRLNNRSLASLALVDRNSIVRDALQKRKQASMPREARALLSVLAWGLQSQGRRPSLLQSLGRERGFAIREQFVSNGAVTTIKGRHFTAEVIAPLYMAHTIVRIAAKGSTRTLATIEMFSNGKLSFFSGSTGQPRTGPMWEALRRAATNMKLIW